MERLTIRKSDFAVAKRGSDAVSILQAVDHLADIEDILGDDYDLDRLRELVKADREGRCVVLPCNLGDHIYRVVAGYIFEGIFFIEDAPRFGKNVFLTREAAEAALKGEQDGRVHQ